MSSWFAFPGLPPFTFTLSKRMSRESFIWIIQVRLRTTHVIPWIEMARLVHHDRMPVRFMDPACIVVRILWPVVHNYAASKDANVIHLPHVQATQHHGTRRQVNRAAQQAARRFASALRLPDREVR